MPFPGSPEHVGHRNRLKNLSLGKGKLYIGEIRAD